MKRLHRRAGAQAAGIGIAIGVASAAGLLLLVLVGRMLTPEDYALFVSFWAVLFGIGGSMSTIEQEAARQVSSGDPHGPSVRAIAVSSAVLGGLVAAVTALPPLAQRLYGQSTPAIGGIVVLATVGFAVQFAVRGVLMGSGLVRQYSLIIVTEAVLRVVVLGGIAATLGVGLHGAAVAVAVGSYAWIGWALTARAAGARPAPAARAWSRAVRRSTSLMAAAALTAGLVTGFPALVSVFTEGGTGRAGGAVFAALTVSRVPLLLVSPIQAMAVPAVVRWRTAPPTGAWQARRILGVGTVTALAAGLLAGGAGWLWGPAVVTLVYGPRYDVPGSAVGMLALSAVLLAWVLLISAALVALTAYRRMVLMWSAALAATVLWLIVSPLDVVGTTAVGALIGPVIALVVATPVLAGLLPSSDDLPS